MITSALPVPGQLALVWLFGATQVIGYGTVYYSFAILAGSIADTFAWPVSWVFAAFSFALLLGGFAAPTVGRMIDRHGGPAVMAVGSIVTAGLLAATAVAPGPIAFVFALCALEIASTLILYDAAFAALVQLCGTAARLRITHLTLIAGFASTLFWPLTTWLHGTLDWRAVFLVFAALHLCVCFPMHLFIAATRPPPRRMEGGQPAAPAALPETAVAPADAARVLLLITLGFALSGFLLSAILAQMVPALTSVGLGGEALLVATLFGPAQVLVRFVNMALGSGRHPLTITIAAMSMLPVAVAVLAVTAPSLVGAAVFAILLGFGSGLKSIVQGTLPLALFGGASYGARLGRMAFARQFLAAVAPFAFALTLDTLGSTAGLALLLVVSALGLAAFVAVARILARGRTGSLARPQSGT